jgi:hypothetical protein
MNIWLCVCVSVDMRRVRGIYGGVTVHAGRRLTLCTKNRNYKYTACHVHLFKL